MIVKLSAVNQSGVNSLLYPQDKRVGPYNHEVPSTERSRKKQSYHTNGEIQNNIIIGLYRIGTVDPPTN